jgi:hypothetical protein
MQNCVDDNQLYASDETCLRTCSLFPALGSAEDATGNTVGCRLHHAELARETKEPPDHCPKAGPGGSGTCGDDCELYCDLVARVCEGLLPPDLQTPSDCLQTCNGLARAPTYSITADNTATLDCRLFHVTNASFDPETHCPHATGLTRCVDGG